MTNAKIYVFAKTVENTKLEHKIEIDHLNDKIDSLEKENAALKIENTKLKDDNERLRRIINNDSTNSSLPPSSDEKPAKATNEFNHRNKTKKKQGAQKGHTGTIPVTSLICKPDP